MLYLQIKFFHCPMISDFELTRTNVLITKFSSSDHTAMNFELTKGEQTYFKNIALLGSTFYMNAGVTRVECTNYKI